ncbi:MAG: hypothetical protein WA938_03425 [Candidatus Dormiibacterota bacterium]
MAFKRASLSGSEQLFQPTRGPSRRHSDAEEGSPRRGDSSLPLDEVDAPLERKHSGGVLFSEVSPTASGQGHLYRLNDEEVEVLLSALQHAKFPHSYQRLPKPAMEDFEQLEALRQKISDQREAGG